MNKLPFKFDDGALVQHATGSSAVSFKIVERNHADGGNYYLCAPLKRDGTINRAIRPFRFQEENIREAGAIDALAMAAAERVRQFLEMTEKQQVEYFISIAENQVSLSEALTYVIGWIQGDERVNADIKHILKGRGEQVTHEGAKEILLEVARKAIDGK